MYVHEQVNFGTGPYLDTELVHDVFRNVYGAPVVEDRCKRLHEICCPNHKKLKVGFQDLILAVHAITPGVKEGDEAMIHMVGKMCLTPGVGIVKEGLFPTIVKVGVLKCAMLNHLVIPFGQFLGQSCECHS